MATGYWLGTRSNLWQDNDNWTAAYPSSLGDTAYFAANTSYSDSAFIASGLGTVFCNIDVLGTQTNPTGVQGSGDLIAINVYARAGSGGLTISTATIDTNTGVTNESSNPITFLNLVTPSFHPTFRANSTGGITLSGGINLSGASAGFKYVTVNSSGSGVTTFASVSNAVDGFFVTAGIADITAAGSTDATISAGATLRLGTGTQSGTLAGSGTLAKNTSGTLVLSNANTHSGGTTLSQGTLKTGNAAALGTGTVSVGSAAKLQLGTAASGKATLGGRLTINGGTLHIGG